MYSVSVCLLLMPSGNIHYYIKVTVCEDWRVVTFYKVEGIDPPTHAGGPRS